MPQNTNLNISPYFDDFDSNKNYQRVLFKPATPIQARELTTLQTGKNLGLNNAKQNERLQELEDKKAEEEKK